MKRSDNPYHWCSATSVCCKSPGYPSDPGHDECPCHREPEFHAVVTLMRRVRRDRWRRGAVSVLLGGLIGVPLGDAITYFGTFTGSVMSGVAVVSGAITVAFHLKNRVWMQAERAELNEAARTINRLLSEMP